MIRHLYTATVNGDQSESNTQPFTSSVLRRNLTSVIFLANTYKTWAPASKNCAYCLRVYGVVLLVHHAGINLVSVGRIELPPHAPKARMIPFHHTEKKLGAPRQNRTAITGLQNQCTTIVLVGLKIWWRIRESNSYKQLAKLP